MGFYGLFVLLPGGASLGQSQLGKAGP